jgi:TRAP-type C4-dicarboxylate transport system substrate-binding protein
MAIGRRSLAAGAAAASFGFMLGNPAKAQPVRLRYANASNAQLLTNQAMQRFADELRARSNGAIDIQLVLNAGSEQSIVESVALGSMDMALTGYSGIAEYDVLYTPSLLRDVAHGIRVMDGPLGQRAAQAFQRRWRARVIGGGSSGGFNISLRTPITSWQSFRGQKIRVPPFDSYPPAVQLLGAIPTPVPFNEVYLALQQGVADGLITLINVMLANRFHEVSRFVVSNDFGVGMDKIFISERSWARLSADQQRLFLTVFREIQEEGMVQRPMRTKQEDIARWRAANGQNSVVDLDQAELERIMEPLARRLVTEVYGAGAYEQIKAA